MTETTASGAAQDGTGARKGLTISRINTRDGVHPYDEVTWERRDVVMTNWRDGSVNFEQRGVEFPDFWSVNAANIVTTKYFRGAVGPGMSTATSPPTPTPRSSTTSSPMR